MKISYMKFVFILLIVIGFAARLMVTDWEKNLSGDEIGYDKMTRQLIEDGIYGYTPYSYSVEPNAFTTPGYPLFLAAFYFVFGFNETESPLNQIQFVQVLISVMNAILLFMIAQRLFKNSIVSTILMALFLFHPTFVYSASFMLTETVYTFFFLLFVLFLIRTLQNPSKMIAYFYTGCIFALCILIRPAIMPFIFLFALYLLFVNGRTSIRSTLKKLLLIFVGVSLVMSPWVIRNYVTLDRVVLLAEQGGNPLLWGTYPFQTKPKIDVTQDPDEMKSMALSRIKEGFTHNTALYASWYTWGKTWFLFKDIWPGNNKTANEIAIKYIHYLVVILGFIGMIFMLLNYKNKSIFSAALIGSVSFLVYLPFAPTSRYFFSVLPLCILGCGYLIHLLVNLRLRGSSVSQSQ